MNEKAYKAMNFAGVSNIVIGVVVAVVGVAAGVLAIVSGARLLKDKKGLFEEANNGTIFLDEIGEMAFELQAKGVLIF